MEEATLGGGCFWCLEAIFKNVKGVETVYPGYAGGHTVNPSYEQVCTGTTGHAEVIRVIYNPDIISYETLLKIFFAIHDPTTKNRQGNDIGTQYRSVIFYHNQEQKETGEKVLKEMQQYYDKPIVTEIQELKNFFPAEKYHWNYYEKHPEQAYCQMVISPKVAKFKKQFLKYLK